jgi:mono/diheme cytochrome c family protein
MRLAMRCGLLVILALALSACAALAQDGALVAQGRRLFTEQGCFGCHTVGAFGTPIAPDLSRVGAKYPLEYLTRWLRDPASQRPAHMPKIPLTEAEVQALAAYLGSLR